MLRSLLKRSVSSGLFVLIGLAGGMVPSAHAGDLPYVSAVSPLEATVGVPVALTASYSGFTNGVGTCYLLIDGMNGIDSMSQVDPGTKNSSSGVVTQAYTFSTMGNHSAYVKCANGTASGNEVMIFVSGANTGNSGTSGTANTVTPSIGAINLQTAIAGTPVTISATYQNFSGSRNTTCHIVDNAVVGIDTLTPTSNSTSQSGTISRSYTFTSAGNHKVQIQCGTANDLTLSSEVSIAVSADTGTGANNTTTDTSKPVVGAITPTTVTAGVAQTFSATYSDTGTGVAYCRFSTTLENGPANITGTGLSGTVSITKTFTSAGTASLVFFCYDGANNVNSGNFATITVSSANNGTTGAGTSGTSAQGDSVAPAVGAVTPGSATLNTATTFSASYSDAVGVRECYLYVNGLNTGTMSRAAANSGASASLSGVASASYTFTANSSVGTNTVRVECTDDAGNRGIGANASVTVAASATTSGTDTTSPVVNAVTASTAVVNVPVTLSASFSDAMGVTDCYLYVDSVSMGIINRTGSSISGTASMNYTFSGVGNHTARIECVDAARNRGIGANKTIVVGAAGSAVTDTTLPIVASLSYSSVIAAGSATRFETSVSDAGGVSSCSLQVNGASSQVMSLVGTTSNYTSATAAASYTFTVAGTYNVRTECVDTAGNRALSPVAVISVGATGTTGGTTAGSTANTNAPMVSAVYPGSVGVGAQTSYSVTFTSPLAVNGCSFYVNDVYTGVMGLSGTATNGAANYLHAFTTPGNYQVRVECVDSSSRRGIGPTGTVTVTAGATASTTSGTGSTVTGGTASSAPGTTTVSQSTEVRTTLPPAGSLIKSPCPDGASSDNPCKAVYYYSRNGMRYAFPHERIFLTWYSNFDSVIQVSDSIMASIRLGGNVTYRPGVRLLKFTSVPQVYAVGRGGVLRWITSEALAISLYGPNWNQNVHDIPDGYFNNYTFGANIATMSDYTPIAESLAVPTIDDNR